MKSWAAHLRADELVPRLEPSLSLAALKPFAGGRYRRCYVHPTSDELCVKVVASDDKRCRVQQRLDLCNYRFLRRHGSEAFFDRIPTIKGIVNTDLGTGIVMQLYRNMDGSVSRSLADLIREYGLTPPLVSAACEMRRWLRAHRLWTRDTGPHNMIAVRCGGSDWTLRIAEGWVHRYWPFMRWCPGTVIDRLINRQIANLDGRLLHTACGEAKVFFQE